MPARPDGGGSAPNVIRAQIPAKSGIEAFSAASDGQAKASAAKAAAKQTLAGTLSAIQSPPSFVAIIACVPREIRA